MKVTAIIPDSLVNEVKNYSSSATITEAITLALKDWLALYHIKALNQKIQKNPLIIKNGAKIRRLNRMF
ncbi:hypothetical protein NO1_0077 [Candidatus Termititenax aidoneus]|uniref:DUF2191 domain-containing protein n=1 Tax=Termititenax aidoneus TaxID=2218524 RepID=A0A388T7E2_TERA1|nr:hypothetical protein NO1_0077 [Candidatus Termititenax aidoneus]